MDSVSPVFRTILIRVDIAIMKHRYAITTLDYHFYIPDTFLSAATCFRCFLVHTSRTAIPHPVAGQGDGRIVQGCVIAAEVDGNKSWGRLQTVGVTTRRSMGGVPGGP
jgi:hypothetical protein